MNDKCTDHPYYGRIAKSPDGRLICHICGQPFVKLGSHVVQKHGMTSRQYKQMFGLEVGKGLITTEHKQHLRDCVMRNYDKVVAENLIEYGGSTRFTPGHPGRTREMVSEQTRLKLIQNCFKK